jgi:hypothetical protein
MRGINHGTLLVRETTDVHMSLKCLFSITEMHFSITKDSLMSLSATDSPLRGVRVLPLRSHIDMRRSLVAVTGNQEIPFAIAQTYAIYGTRPRTVLPGAHAHREIAQVLIAVVGGFTITLSDGALQVVHRLNSPTHGLYIPPMIWGEFSDFSEPAVCLVLASGPFDENEYIRDKSFLPLMQVHL